MKFFKNKYTIIPLIAAVISIIMLFTMNIIYKPGPSKLYTDFLKDVNSKKVKEIYVTNSDTIEVKLNNGKIYQTDNPQTSNFKEKMLLNGVKISDNSSIYFKEKIPAFTLFISILVLFIMFLKSSKSAMKGFLSVDSLSVESAENSNYSFKDVAGNEEAKESMKDIIDFLKSPEKFTAYGARMPRGVILYGKPGTGKTLMAKAVAGEAGVPFYAMSGSDFIQVYVGVGASRIRQLFKKARLHGKAVIFTDEIDAIGKARSSGKAGGTEERDQTLNALLTEMSGFNNHEGIVVMAATNRFDMLDPALLRPGRFDRHIEINLPDVSAREKILSLHFKNKPTKNVHLDEWARKTAYFSGAKLENLANEAAIIACREKSGFITDIQIDKAYSIVLAGYEKSDRNFIKNSDKKITAFHEAGHALVSMNLLPDEKISKITIIPSTKGAGGYTLSIPQDKMYQSKEYLEKKIMVLFAGRAAEEIIFGEASVTNGAYNDIKNSTNLILNMASEYGMSKKFGLLNLNEINQSDNSISLLEECKKISDDLYNKTKKILIENINILYKLEENLIEKETLYYEDIETAVMDLKNS